MPAARTTSAALYERGRGVRRDRVEAVRWYRLAAQQGNETGDGLRGMKPLRRPLRVAGAGRDARAPAGRPCGPRFDH